MTEELTHINEKGEAKMVDVSPKDDTVREAVVHGPAKSGDIICMTPQFPRRFARQPGLPV